MADTKNTFILDRIRGARSNGERCGICLRRQMNLAIAKLVSNEQLIEEEGSLQKVETSVENKLSRSSRLLADISGIACDRDALAVSLSRSIDLHRPHDNRKHARERLEKAMRLTRAAVYGEKLYASCGSGSFTCLCGCCGGSSSAADPNRDAKSGKTGSLVKRQAYRARPDIYQDGAIDGHARRPVAAAVC